MALREAFKALFNKENKMDRQYANFMSANSPIFSQFGTNIYASDIVQNCIDIIATECSKLQPRHISVDGDGMQTIPRGSINRLLKFGFNELMTTRDSIEKIIWLLMMNYNCFIYPLYELKYDTKGYPYKDYKGFYPLNPKIVTFLQDGNGTVFTQLSFSNGEEYTIPYSEIIHLRKKFSVNEIMGGGYNGQPDNQALLKILSINDTVLQGIEKAVKTSFSIRGIVKINTLFDDAAQKAERIRFEAAMNDSISGILAMDLKGDYVPISTDPKLVDKETLEFIEGKVLKWYGVSKPIYDGDFTDDQNEAFHQKTIEAIIISLGQAFSKTIFSQRELDVGNEIVFYQKDLSCLSTKTKLDLIKTVGEQGLLTDNQKLAVLGYPPILGGDRRTVSLNYIDVTLVNDYQMQNAGNKGAQGNGKTNNTK